MQPSIQSVGNVISTLSGKADLLYRFVVLYYDLVMEKKDYGTGRYVSMAEAHTLLKIVQRPGITVSEIAVDTNRTKSFISQTVKSLEKQDYVKRCISEEDGRVYELYATENGLVLDRAHKLYDSFEVSETFESLLKYCNEADLDAFFRVVNAYLIILEEEARNKS